MHPGFRQYWRDFGSLEAFTRASQHQAWWRDFARGSGGGGIWHECQSARERDPQSASKRDPFRCG